MGRLRVWFLVLLFAIVASASAAAALGSVSLTRSVSAGTVLADNDENVAIYFEALNSSDILTIDSASGEVTIDLTKEIGTSAGEGFNTNAEFGIGTSSAPILRITNNSDISVTLSFTDENGALSLEGNTIIGSGSYKDYYFTLDTTGINQDTTITATLSVSSN